LLSLPSCMYIYMNSNTIDSPSKHHMQYLSNHSHHPCFFSSSHLSDPKHTPLKKHIIHPNGIW
jgi:hypothetical protein